MVAGTLRRHGLQTIRRQPIAYCRASRALLGRTSTVETPVLQHRDHSTTATAGSPSSSVSPSEVSHFSRLASTWWDPHGPSRLLHLVNPLRHDFIQTCLSSSPPTAQSYSFLDIGCGGGIFASSAARLPSTSTVTAIDPTELVIEVAKSNQRTDPALSPPKLRYLNCAIEDLPIPASDDQKVDIITLFEVLEHIDSPSSFIDLAIPHLKPGGWIIGSTIARSPMSYLTTKLIAEAPLIGVVPAGTHDWNKYINPSELRGYFETRAPGTWGDFRTQGVIYVPALGWKAVNKSEDLGNYFFGVQKLD
ncbi:Hexaprenyldihydroxybenzoate methyltransferase, mitochondrial [Elasticomyces elasticus]|uniref:Ubiquinone biosynthesis O-methyltransferase, mitochondrial n=1 Tax=Exophiala sideris TaxID=1016849 RepID=A0ABR0J8J9_9EURO|nr:Hexaprenyldihydroxybenzoate methyltransferase, mitochondrial [Elasticomyces elasticus]KAK5037407.1 Hexaprenyldihydroxybenzoate methyltransferase, mitochondrial [Exophiala sideris]KAK5059069.1 Hexaprenyldihydroxybenzoate methyltransferase, mitochondrial [Exophiala sideris]KAK5182902.1 Hexaprenyldihydroxybenzoate methyltransferase, mitochondrial [Eurotiomycetes sp. CCFEE 6388]